MPEIKIKSYEENLSLLKYNLYSKDLKVCKYRVDMDPVNIFRIQQNCSYLAKLFRIRKIVPDLVESANLIENIFQLLD